MKGSSGSIDELYELFKVRKRVTLAEAAKVLGIPRATALRWAKMLQEDGVIEIEAVGDEVILNWAGAKKAKHEEAPKPEHVPRAATPEKEFQQLVHEYEQKIEAIRRSSAELQDLDMKRADLISTRYVPLERKFETELQLLHDGLAEKERHISELDKRIRAMPDKVAGIEEQSQKLEQIESYARKSVSEARIKIQAEAERITEAQAAIDKHIKEVSAMLEEQTGKLKRVERELIRLRKIEQWMIVQQRELERSLDEVSAERKESLKSFSSLKSSLSLEYVKNYIKELGTLKDKYAREAHGIRQEEDALNQSVSDSRKELSRLTAESKEIIERFETVAGKRKGKKAASSEWKAFEKSLDSLASSNIE